MSTLSYPDLRQALIDAGLQLIELGVLTGIEGNLSVRVPDHPEAMIISPAGVKARQLTPEKMLVVGFDGKVLEGNLKPSSGVPMHAMAYRLRPNANAVIHTHSTAATAHAIANKPIPLVLEAQHDMVGGAVPVARYARLGTQALANNVAAAMTESWAVLLQNHGVLAFGKDLKHAIHVAAQLESAAKMAVMAQVLGNVGLLPLEEAH